MLAGKKGDFNDDHGASERDLHNRSERLKWSPRIAVSGRTVSGQTSAWEGRQRIPALVREDREKNLAPPYIVGRPLSILRHISAGVAQLKDREAPRCPQSFYFGTALHGRLQVDLLGASALTSTCKNL